MTTEPGIREFNFEGDLGLIWEEDSEFSAARYRYAWGQIWEIGKGQVCWILLNPSTADDSRDDPTIRRCRSFSQRWGFGSFIVVNLFAMRATDPKELRRMLRDPAVNPLEVIGPKNALALESIVPKASLVVVGWGNNGRYLGREMLDNLWTLTEHYESPPVRCFGLTQQRQPRHPLYVAGDTELVEVPAAARA